jgi:hypothetical protein
MYICRTIDKRNHVTFHLKKYPFALLAAFLSLFICNSIYSQTEEVSIIRQDCSGYSNCYSSLAAWQEDYGGIDFGSHEQGDLVAADIILDRAGYCFFIYQRLEYG